MHTVEEIVAVMRAAGETTHGQRLRGMIVVLWRAGLRISEALAPAEADPDPRRGAVLVAAAARSAWTSAPGGAAAAVVDRPLQLPVGAPLCVINGPTRGRHWSIAAARAQLRDTAAVAGVSPRTARRRARPRRRAARGHPTAARPQELQGIDNAEIIEAVHARRAPIVPVRVTLGR
jgi:hypothetical protein